jgi:hypothetical protein
MRTNESLMKLLGITFHFERLKVKYMNVRTAETVLVLMTRARKLFEAIARLLTIFRLVEQRLEMNSLETELRITAKRPSSATSRNEELEKLV